MPRRRPFVACGVVLRPRSPLRQGGTWPAARPFARSLEDTRGSHTSGPPFDRETRLASTLAEILYRIRGLRTIGHVEPVWMGAPGLPRAPDATTCIREAFLTTPASVDVDVIAATFAHRLIYGYVRGAAEGLLAALVNLDLNVSVISDEEMSCLDLSMFDAIVVGPNAYLLRDELRRNARRSWITPPRVAR